MDEKFVLPHPPRSHAEAPTPNVIILGDRACKEAIVKLGHRVGPNLIEPVPL